MRTVGFTLIETLAVVAILGILTSILFPILATAEREGERPDAVSRLRQLSVAAELYEADGGPLVARGEAPWPELLETVMPTIWSFHPPKWVPPYLPGTSIGYVLNTCLEPNVEPDEPARTIRFSESTGLDIAAPGSGSSSVYGAAFPDTFLIRKANQDFPSTLYRQPEPPRALRYRGRGVYAALDGHVQTLEPGRVGFDIYSPHPCFRTASDFAVTYEPFVKRP